MQTLKKTGIAIAVSTLCLAPAWAVVPDCASAITAASGACRLPTVSVDIAPTGSVTGFDGQVSGESGSAGIGPGASLTPALTNDGTIAGGAGAGGEPSFSGGGGAGGAGGAAIDNAGTITDFVNRGTITGGGGGNGGSSFSGDGGAGGVGGAAINNAGTITDFVNRGTITGGGGGNGGSSFSGNRGAGGAGGAAINNAGTITSFSNYGTLAGGLGGSGMSVGSTGFGIANSGTITRLINGQNNLTYTGALPGNYYTYFSNAATYGKVSFAHSGSYTLANYGLRIASGENYATGTYAGVITTDGALSISGYESISGVTYHLVAAGGGGTSWNLVIDSVVTNRVTAAASSLGNAMVLPATRIIDANPNLLALFVPLTTNAQLSNGANAITPLLSGGSIAATRSSLNSVNGTIQSRIAHISGRASGDSFLGDQNVWLKPFASRADQDERAGVAGYKAETYGIVGGVDGALSPALRIGGAFAYATSDVSGKAALAPQSNEVNIYQLIGYGSYAINDRTHLDFQADVGQNTNQGRRQIAFTSSVATSDYRSTTAHAGIALGRAYALSASTTLTPSLRADYTWIKDQSYQESGAGLLSLKVASRSTEAFVVGVDGQLAHQLNAQTTLIGNLGVGYDTINSRDAISAAFAGAPSAAFVTYGIDPSPWIGRAGIGAVYKLKNGLEITGRYDMEYRQSFLNQTASANMRWAF